MRLDRRSRNQGRIPRGDTRVAQVVLTVAHLALSFQRSRSKKEITCKAGGDWNLLVGSAAYLCRTDASWSAFLHSGSDLSRTFRRVLQRVVLSSTETCPALATCHSRPRETGRAAGAATISAALGSGGGSSKRWQGMLYKNKNEYRIAERPMVL